ncbi:hypothetical protein Trco_008486 [Trichoderma cornu-damae]|uniref:Uncharacterized protein n=1 Tax=Trichoderma cornu-damae TaxID=654480 RepID=A0A9P8TRF3_9HYPO|nr:hypothetical protein Trco_008486 [Trichoderma cornu-damae]
MHPRLERNSLWFFLPPSDFLVGKEVSVNAGRLVSLVLNGELLESGDDVLDNGILLLAVLAAEVVQRRDLVQDEVDNGNEDGDAERVQPDDDNGDDVGPAVVALLGKIDGVVDLRSTREPAEESEESSQDIDAENGADELPGGPSAATTGNEDEPVLGEGDLEEEDLLDGAEVLDDAAVGEVHGSAENPGAEGEEDAEDDGDDPDLGQLPLYRARLVVGIVVSDSDGGQISEQGKEDDEVDADGLVDDDHRQGQVDLQVETEGDAVLDVGLHALEDLTGSLDGQDDGAEAGGEEDDIGSSLGSLGGTLDSDAAVGLLQGGGIVDTVAGHGSKVAALLEHLDDAVLVLGEDLGEAVGALDEVVLDAAGETTVDELLGVVNLGAEGQHLAGLLGNGDGVTGQHLDGDAELGSLEDGLGGILTGGVEHGKEAKENPLLVVLLVGNAERPETTAGELAVLLAVDGGEVFGGVGKLEDGLGGALGADELVLAEAALGSDALGDGVEGGELFSDPALLKDLASLGIALEGEDGDLVNGVEGLEVVGGSESGDGHHPVDVLSFADEGVTDGELVGSESAGLVRAEDVDASEGLDGGELLDDGLLLGEVGSADSQRGGGDDGKTDGDTNDEEDEGVVEQVLGARLGDLEVTEESTNPGGENPEHDEDEQACADVVHDSLEVTLILGTLDEIGGLADEGVLGGGRDDGISLSALAAGGVVGNIAEVLVDGEGFTSDGGLIHGNEGSGAVADQRALLLFVFLLVVAASQLAFGAELLEDLEVLRARVVADEEDVRGDGVTFLDNEL